MEPYDCAFTVAAGVGSPVPQSQPTAVTAAEAARAPSDSPQSATTAPVPVYGHREQADLCAPSGPGAGGAGQMPQGAAALLLATPAHKRPHGDATDAMRRMAANVTSDMSPMAPMAPMAPMPMAPVPTAPVPMAKRYKQQHIEQHQCNDWLENLPPFTASNASPFAQSTLQPTKQPQGRLSAEPPPPPTPSPPDSPPRRLPPDSRPPPPLQPQPPVASTPIVDVYVGVSRILGFDGQLPWHDHPQGSQASHL